MGKTILNSTKTILINQKIRFLITGVINTLAGYSTFMVAIYVKYHYLAANIMATIVGITTSYFLNKYFTFKIRRISFTEILRFLLVYFFSFIISSFILYILIDLIFFNPYVAGIINLFIITMISWYGHRYFTFRN